MIILVRVFLLSLKDFIVLTLKLPSPLLEQDLLFIEGSPAFDQVLLPLLKGLFTLLELPLFGLTLLLDHVVDLTATLGDFLGELVHLDLLLELLPETFMLLEEELSLFLDLTGLSLFSSV